MQSSIILYLKQLMSKAESLGGAECPRYKDRQP